MANRGENDPMLMRTVALPGSTAAPGSTVHREWLVTNGIGGYASATVDGVHTRSYHGILIAALPAPLGRTVMWSHLFERLVFADGEAVSLKGVGSVLLEEFHLENGLPVWRYRARDVELTRRVFLPHLQNTVVLTYELGSGSDSVDLELRPGFDFRKHGLPVEPEITHQYQCAAADNGYEITATGTSLPACRLKFGGDVSFTAEPEVIESLEYSEEAGRGYPYIGQLWNPGTFRMRLRRGEIVALIGSTESWSAIHSISPSAALTAEQQRRAELLATAGTAANDPVAAELVLAADQFIIRPVGRAEHGANRRAEQITSRTVIAGYHWFTDWGRDTMISFEGLTLTTGRFAEARQILLTFASYVRDGLIPNLFPDGEEQGLYHTADASLWFFHAVERYARLAADRATLEQLLPTMVEIADAHLRGTRFNIHVDAEDGLLAQGAEGYQLTWMDAKMGDWIVTPRRGKAVELNALWFNALKLLAGWLRDAGNDAAAEKYDEHARRTYLSFNERFWFESGGYLYDVVDGPGGDDASCRPNQIFAVALDHPVLARERWAAVVAMAERELVTPVGLRSLAPGHPDYQPIYSGDLRSRDGAYHQGTVWGWLIGPFVDAWIKVHPAERAQARAFLDGFQHHLGEAGVGTISEVFDGREPHTPGGCIAQAWSVAEVLRCWIATSGR